MPDARPLDPLAALRAIRTHETVALETDDGAAALKTLREVLMLCETAPPDSPATPPRLLTHRGYRARPDRDRGDRRCRREDSRMTRREASAASLAATLTLSGAARSDDRNGLAREGGERVWFWSCTGMHGHVASTGLS